MWTIVAVNLVAGIWQRFRFVGAFASPLLFVLGVFALFPDLDPELANGTHEFSGALSSLHKALLMLSFGGFGLSAVGAVMYLTQEKDLKLHKFRAILSKLPSLERLETAMTRLVWIAFGLLTAGLITSSAYLHQVKQVWFKADPEMIWVMGVWAFYLVLLVLRNAMPIAAGGLPGVRWEVSVCAAHLLGRVPVVAASSNLQRCLVMPIVCLGLNHRTAPVTVRERFALPEGELPVLLGALRERTVAKEAVILSTCNRVEIYAATEDEPQVLLNELRAFLLKDREVDADPDEIFTSTPANRPCASLQGGQRLGFDGVG